ncbi:hypothetical protein P154DRAFT_610822 [Amniculicola lignicola CBS 123094]|uniref:Cellulose-binding family II protein n=1 Tax=Amniculicola lignicola CBS 123094 TaxID=1392246 RepID=A0A6A5W8M8_9PLEO|nr:hypothetical protein P154DRAFT_610822 [Amniculicola lignicola CBS 123094]
MKTTLAISTLFGLSLAAPTPNSLIHNHKRLAQPICTFDDHSFDDSNAWPALSSDPTSKRDLNSSTWTPPSNLVTPLKQVWNHEMSTYSNPLGFMNYGFDQVIAAKGKINYCVRWDSSESVTAAQRTKVEAAIRRSFNQWMAVLAGFDGWPYATVDVNVVGWAVKNKALLQGDTSKITVYTTTDSAGVPQCAEGCGRFFHQDNNYSGCVGGSAKHYDQSLWLTAGMDGGAGGDWGQRVGSEYFMQNIDSKNIHIVLHELGHTFALDEVDFYDWTPTGVTNFIMLAGSSMEITEFDAWMVRDWWRNLKSRYHL